MARSQWFSPKEKNVISFGVLLNLVSASNAENEEVLWKFINNYSSNIVKEDHPILQKLTKNAIQYFNDIVKPSKKYRPANENEKKAILDLIEVLKKCQMGKIPQRYKLKFLQLEKIIIQKKN